MFIVNEQEQAVIETAEQTVESTVERELTPEEQLQATYTKCEQIATICANLGLEVERKGTWVIVRGNTMPYKKLLGFNYQPSDPNNPDSPRVQKGLGLSWKGNVKYWAYEGELPDGYYYSKRENVIKKRGE